MLLDLRHWPVDRGVPGVKPGVRPLSWHYLSHAGAGPIELTCALGLAQGKTKGQRWSARGSYGGKPGVDASSGRAANRAPTSGHCFSITRKMKVIMYI